MKQSDKNKVILWLLSGCFLIYCMVVIGGITRLTHSGLSMVEWKPVSGAIPPLTQADWEVMFKKYQTSPEYKIVNSDFTLSDFKSIFWWEYIHRLVGRLIGLVFFVPFAWFILTKKLSRKVMIRSLIILALGGFQGVLGWYMVASGLVKNPHVSHYRLAAHLLSAFMVFGFTFWLAMDLKFGDDKHKPRSFPILWRTGIVLFILVCLQIAYGAFTAGLKAGYGYNTYPKMGTEWFPSSAWMYDSFLKNILESPYAVQFVHRWLAALVVCFVVFVWFRARKQDMFPLQRLSINLLLLCVSLQFLLGLLTLLLAVPVVLGVLHQTGAFFLFCACLFYLFQMKKGVNTQPVINGHLRDTNLGPVKTA